MSGQRQSIWDLPTRLFHWSFAILVGLMWLTGEEGAMDWHRRLGLALVGLIIFRIYWGFAGPANARFSSFQIHPKQIAAYLPKLLKRPYTPQAGHNPLGALSVIALLSAVAFQLGTGLFSIDVDGLESGHLAVFVEFDTGRYIADLHETSFNVVLGLVILHLSAIAYYLIALRTNLIGTMITGKRTVEGDAEVEAGGAQASVLRFAIGLALAAAAVFAILEFGA